MAKSYNYAIIGAGRQGTATAYDLAKWGDAASIILADFHGDVALRSAERINRLIGEDLASGVQINVNDYAALVELLKPVDVLVCGTPFIFIPICTKAAIETGTGMVDYGGHTATVLSQLNMDEKAQEKNMAIVPDCGMGPGMNNSLGVYCIEQLREKDADPYDVRLWDGGLPLDRPEPWGYKCTFHINGLTNEYDGQALFLRDGQVTPVDALTELEEIEFEGFGTLEAFVTSGGTSTVPYTFEGQIEVYENKTCRYPGHYAQFKAFKDLGLFSEESLEVVPGGDIVNPRQFYHTLLEPQISAENLKDVCIMRARGIGKKDGKDVVITVEVVDYYDEETGFTAMERMTGWHAGIVAELIARGEIAPGVLPLEKSITQGRIVEKMQQRGFKITERWQE